MKTRNPWYICLTTSLFFSYQFFQINMFNSIGSELAVSLNTSPTELSLLSSIYFYGTIILLIPAGILLDRFPPKALLIGAMLVSILGNIIFATSTNLHQAAIGRFIVGISGGPFGFLCTMRIAANWFPQDKLGFVTGIIVAMGMLGGILSQSPFAQLVNSIGWVSGMVVNILVGTLILIALIVVVKDRASSNRNRESEFITGLKLVVKNSRNWTAGLYASFLNLPIFVLGAYCGSRYLVSIHNISVSEAYSVCTMLYVGMLVGSPFFGKVADFSKSYKTPMLIGASLCIASMFMVLLISFNLFTLHVLFFLIGFGSSAQSLAYPFIASINSPSNTGSALGLAATLIMGGGAIFQPIYALTVENHLQLPSVFNIHSFSKPDQMAMFILTIFSSVSIIMLYINNIVKRHNRSLKV